MNKLNLKELGKHYFFLHVIKTATSKKSLDTIIER